MTKEKQEAASSTQDTSEQELNIDSETADKINAAKPSAKEKLKQTQSKKKAKGNKPQDMRMAIRFLLRLQAPIIAAIGFVSLLAISDAEYVSSDHDAMAEVAKGIKVIAIAIFFSTLLYINNLRPMLPFDLLLPDNADDKKA